MRIVVLALLIIALLGLIGGTALAQDPTPIPDPQFPDELPQLPDQLPEDPADVLPLLETLILFGAGLIAKFIPDLVKLVPWVDAKQGENIRRQLLRVVALAGSVVVAMVLPYAGQATDWLTSSGLWAVILAVYFAQWGVYRGDKMLRVIGKLVLAKVS